MLFQLEQTKLISVAVPLPVDDPFTYEVPEKLTERIQPGVRVLVPFKNRQLVGYVVAANDGIPAEGTKKVIEVLDEKPILSDHFLNLSLWMRDYYFSSWGEAIQAIVPKFYRHTKPTKYRESKNIHREELVSAKEVVLNDEQAHAVEKIGEFLKSGQYRPVLLFGVTGSGKSEVYIRSMKRVINMGKSAICLVPEIALTEQLKRFFESHFGEDLEVFHSKLSEGERWQAWERIRKGEKKIVLGARSAVFAPFENLGLIIIDEEQEPSYKQDQTPRYHAREVARWRAEKLNAVLIIGTATPTIEAMKEAVDGKLYQIELTKRVDSKKLPAIDIVDLNQAQAITKNKVIISPKLQMIIQAALEKKEGILLLLNRRGFSTQAHCMNCKKPIVCRYCDVAMTYHQGDNRLLCHYCNYKIDEPNSCPRCGEAILKFSGIGTEKVESEVARLFPTARVSRLDSDSARRKGSHQKILAQFRAQQIDILVGTQMIAKGFDFPHVTVVGVVLADTALELPDFRSSEKTFQLLTQVAGRTGRGSVEGKVVIQTFSPLHYSIQLAKTHDVLGFFNQEIEHSRSFLYPPFVQLINVMFRGKIERRVIEQAGQFQKLLTDTLNSTDVETIGPAPLPFRKLRGNYRWHIMLKCKTPLQTIAPLIRGCLKQFKKSGQVHLAFDVDPVSIL